MLCAWCQAEKIKPRNQFFGLSVRPWVVFHLVSQTVSTVMGLCGAFAEFDWEFVIIRMKTNDKQRLKQPAALPPSVLFCLQAPPELHRVRVADTTTQRLWRTIGGIWDVWALSKDGEENKLSCTAVLKETSLIDNLLLLSVSDDVLSGVLLRYACFLCWPATDNTNPLFKTLHTPPSHNHTLGFTCLHTACHTSTETPTCHPVHACMPHMKHEHAHTRTCLHTHFLSLSHTHTHTRTDTLTHLQGGRSQC